MGIYRWTMETEKWPKSKECCHVATTHQSQHRKHGQEKGSGGLYGPSPPPFTSCCLHSQGRTNESNEARHRITKRQRHGQGQGHEHSRGWQADNVAAGARRPVLDVMMTFYSVDSIVGGKELSHPRLECGCLLVYSANNTQCIVQCH